MKLEKKDVLEKLKIKLNLFIYNYEYQILIISSIFCGFLIFFITNKFFINTRIYFFLLFLGIFVSSLGFLLEKIIKNIKRKSIDNSFSYFLQDLSREYKNKKNLSLALVSISKSNFYGSIDVEIKRIANRVSWGDEFESSLENINKNIKSDVIKHTLILLKTFKNSEIPFDRILLNISKDLLVLKDEMQKKMYFRNLYYLSIIMLFIFVIVILFINILLGQNFLWYGDGEMITWLFFDNFLLYITILLSIFTAFIMSSIKKKSSFSFLKYTCVFIIIIILIFQIFIPKPEAEEVIIDTIDYMNKNQINYFKLNNIVSLKSLSANYILSKTYSEDIYFINTNLEDCGFDCKEYIIFVDDASFIDFEIYKYDIIFEIHYRIRN